MNGPLSPCVECARPVDVYGYGVVYEVRGFERARTGGGTNHVLFRERTGRVMCQVCAHTKQNTGNAAQGSLL